MARSAGHVREVAAELEDRFGEAPLPALALARFHEIRAECRRLGIARCDWLQVRCMLEFTEDALVSAQHLVALARDLPARMKMRNPTTLEVRFSPEEGNQPYAFLHWVFRQLEGAAS
jgi:transcription-repair coupling factor (superfamily II helicase)